MLIDSKSQLKYRLYESGIISATLSGAGNRTAQGGKDRGCKQKYFKVHKKIIRSTIIRQFNLRKNTIKFITLTFPEHVTNRFANECFSKFVENCKKNYNVHTYVAVKELTKNGRPHYHVFFDMPYCNYSVLNRAWCSTFSDKCAYSSNALQTRKSKSIVKTIKRAVYYASKYVTKPQSYKDSEEYINVSEELYNDYVKNRLFFCDRIVLSNGYVIHAGLMDYLLSIDHCFLFADSDFFQVYVMEKFTPSLDKMLFFVPNYCFFIKEFKILISFSLKFFLFFLAFS